MENCSKSNPAPPSNLDLLRGLTRLATPVVFTQLAIVGFGVVDMLMLGRVSVVALDASALGGLWFFGTAIFGIGVMFGLDPIIAHAHGRGDGPRAGLAVQRGLVTGTLLAVPLAAMGWGTQEVLSLLGQEPALAAEAERYVVMQSWSVAPLLWFHALRQYLQGRELVRPALIVSLFANLANIAVNEVLIFEHGGLGFGMGLTGAGLASGLTRAFLFVGLAVWVVSRGLHRGAWQPWSAAAFEARGLGEILRYGLPAGVQSTVEVWAFQCSTLLAGMLGRDSLAAHSIVLSVSSVTIMTAMGISFAAATTVGGLVGAGRRGTAQRVAWLAIAAGGGLMLIFAVALIATRASLARAYSQDAAVLALAAGIIPIAAGFQLFDGVQTIASGVLRGIGDTMSAAIINVVAYFAIALPLAAYLVDRGYGLPAIWASLALGLGLVAVTLLVWVRWRGPARRGSAEDRRLEPPQLLG